MAHQAAGELDLAAGEFTSCTSPGEYGIRCRGALGELRAREGKTDEARRIARSLPQFVLAAGIYLDLNDHEQALHALERSFTSHESELLLVLQCARGKRSRLRASQTH